jgi:23S rRNA (cytosine1962-C5)-methyltransferase
VSAAQPLEAGRVRLTGRGRRRWLSGHPWIYADDLAEVEAGPGALVAVEDPRGARVAWGLYSAGTKLALRLVSAEEAAPDRDHWRRTLERSVAFREREGLLEPEGACRLLHGDSEGVPGLVIDCYARVVVLQSGTQSSDRLRDLFAELLAELLPLRPRAVVERSDASVRRLEGLEPRTGVLAGELPAELVVREDELLYEVDVLHGHKTGHYLDQRENRRSAARYAADARVLDAFCYDGLFGLRAALAGARDVLCIDQSRDALERLARNAERNGVAGRVRSERADAMGDLRARAAAGEQYDLIALDPPPFARSRAEAAGAERGYRELNLRALRLLAPGGRLSSSSCSHAISAARFVELLAESARDAGRSAWLEELRGAARDHPLLLALPESGYLKCALVRVA